MYFSVPETGLDAGNCSVIYQPLSHIYGMGVALIALWSGKQILLMAKFDMDEYLKLVVKHKVGLYFIYY